MKKPSVQESEAAPLLAEPIIEELENQVVRNPLREAYFGELHLPTTWEDTEFSSDQSALYYVRVLENPVCRWSM